MKRRRRFSRIPKYKRRLTNILYRIMQPLQDIPMESFTRTTGIGDIQWSMAINNPQDTSELELAAILGSIGAHYFQYLSYELLTELRMLLLEVESYYYPNESTESENESIKVLIDQGSAPDELLSDILSDLSVLYRMTGGSGINFELTGITLSVGHE